MSKDERIATIIREALRAATDDADPDAMRRVGRGIGAGLGAPDEADPTDTSEYHGSDEPSTAASTEATAGTEAPSR